jgi:hypothetical protein
VRSGSSSTINILFIFGEKCFRIKIISGYQLMVLRLI